MKKRYLVIPVVLLVLFGLIGAVTVQSTAPLPTAPPPIGPAHELVFPDGSHYAYVWEQETNTGTSCIWTEGSYDPVCGCPCEDNCVVKITPVEITPTEPTPESTPVEITPTEPTPESIPTPEPTEKVKCKPGWGHGDKNHCHDGPPGQDKNNNHLK